MWNGQSVSVILPTYNERDSIRGSIEEFLATGVVDEVLVVNNNASAGTSEEVARTNAREVIETRQGYGSAIQRGLKEASGDLLILAEPDGTFVGRDVFKLLAYSDDFDVVFGTRTTSSLIGQGANMGLFLKWGNWAVAKLMEFLFDTTHLSDVGCTMRLFRKSELTKIQDGFTVLGSHFGPEMMLLVLERGLRYIEVPVHYRARVGELSVTGSHWKAFILGLQMILLILQHRLGLNGPDRTIAILRAIGGALLITGAEFLAGTALLSLFFLLLGRSQPPGLLNYPSPGLQLGLLAMVFAIGTVAFGAVRVAARRIFVIDPEERHELGRSIGRRALGMAAGGSAALALGLISISNDPELIRWGSTLLGMLLVGFIALQTGSVLAGILGTFMGFVEFTSFGGDAVAGAIALLAVWLVLRWDIDRSVVEGIGVVFGIAVGLIVEPVAGVAALVLFLWVSSIRRSEPKMRRGAAALAIAALTPLLLGIAAPGAAPGAQSNLIVSGNGWLSAAVSVWFAAGVIGTTVMLAGFLYLLVGWNERRSGLIPRAAVAAFVFGVLLSSDPGVTANVVLPLLSIGAALLVADLVRELLRRTKPA